MKTKTIPQRTIVFGGRSFSKARGRADYIASGPEEIKPENLSLLLKYHGQPIGTVRLDHRQNGKAIVRLVAIESHLQRQGHGAVLIDLVEKLAIDRGYNELFVHAAPDAIGFYQKLGYSLFNFEKGSFRSAQLHKLI